jgi:hypothetical protein
MDTDSFDMDSFSANVMTIAKEIGMIKDDQVMVFNKVEDVAEYFMTETNKLHDKLLLKSKKEIQNLMEQMLYVEQNMLPTANCGCQKAVDTLVVLYNQVVNIKYGMSTFAKYQKHKNEAKALIDLVVRVKDRIINYFNNLNAIVVYRKCVTANGERNSLLIDKVIAMSDCNPLLCKPCI